MVMVTNSIVVSDGDLENTFDGRDHEELNLGSVAGVTDRGARHERNEDALALATIEGPRGPAVVAVVCDGVSSAHRPDEASLAAARAAVQKLAEAAEAGADPAEASRQAVVSARDAVIALAEDPEDPEEAPAATYISAVVADGEVTLCWMGDSRAYWLAVKPEPMAQPLTRDDSLAEEMVAQGLLSEADAMESPQAHVVTRWIGIGARDAEPHVAQFSPPGPGALLLCSDGLWNYDPDGGELAALAMPAALDNPRAAATALLLFALEAGGIDNITAAIVPCPIAGPDRQTRAS